MRSSTARLGSCWKAVFPIFTALVLLAGCIPSTPETTPPPPPAPTAVQSTPTAPAAAVKPPEQAPAQATTRDGQPGASLKIDGAGAEPNASVTVEPLKEGTGFGVRGTFDLTGTIVPNGPGKWKFTGQFSVAETDFAIGVPEVSSMGTFGTTKDGVTGMKMDAAMILIAIPVRPPAAKAPEGSALRIVPVSVDIDAPANSQFTVTLSQM